MAISRLCREEQLCYPLLGDSEPRTNILALCVRVTFMFSSAPALGYEAREERERTRCKMVSMELVVTQYSQVR